MPNKVRIASYNIHSGVGTDAVYNIERIIQVLQEIEPDIIAIQEVTTDPGICGNTDPVALLRQSFGPYICAAASLIGSRGNHYGNLVLSRHPIIRSSTGDLSSHNREPRNIIDLEIMVDTTLLRVITTHMGLKYAERRAQISRLLPYLARDRDKPVVLLGDMNEWRRGSPALRAINKYLTIPNTPATFTASFPLFALDRIWGHPASLFAGMVVAHRSTLSRKASDHLPVYADLNLSTSGENHGPERIPA